MSSPEKLCHFFLKGGSVVVSGAFGTPPADKDCHNPDGPSMLQEPVPICQSSIWSGSKVLPS